MVDNFGGGENIFFTDDANIVLIDPNSIIDSNGQRKDRVIKQENLVMYANLEVDSVPRTKLSVGRSLDDGISNTTVASINFMKPLGKNSFDTSYTDQFTGGRNIQGEINQLTFDNNNNPQQQNYTDTQILGIKSISVNIPFNGVPEISMTLTDVQGRALFETGGNSPYSVFMYYPYPLFKLTLKGFYGKAIQYKLMLRSFNSSFEASSGNYNIDLKFIARTSAILDDIRLGYLFSLPYMYPIYQQPVVDEGLTPAQATSSVQQIGVGVDQTNTLIKTSKGYSKLKQVFEEYKKNKLIDPNVPVLTLEEMSINLTKYTQFLNEQFEKLDFTNLVALQKYEESIEKYNAAIGEWDRKNLNQRDIIILSDGSTLYGLNPGIVLGVANTELTGKTEQFRTQLQSVPIWGEKIPRPDDFFNIEIFQRKFTKNGIDYEKTYKSLFGLTVTNQRDPAFLDWKTKFILNLENLGALFTAENSNNIGVNTYNPYYYTLNTFTEYITNQIVVINQNRDKENQILNQTLQNRVKTNTSANLTFRPTIRNVIGVIMASVDAFYRMLDDVHKQAWDKRDDKNRIRSILKTNAPSAEGKDAVQSSQQNNLSNVVYPWPQFVQPSGGENNEFEIKYPGSLDTINSTKAYDTTVWPEVDFVEQFLYGLTQKKLDYDSNTQQSPTLSLKYTPSSVIEFKFRDEIYSQKSLPSFIYEMYERILLNSFYSGLYYTTDSTGDLQFYGSALETSNIVNSNVPESDLRNILIEELPKQTIYNYLKSTAGPNNEGPIWNSFTGQTFVTSYINEEIIKSTELFSESSYGKFSRIPIKLDAQNKLINFLSATTSNATTIMDTYPFVIPKFQERMVKANRGLYETVETYHLEGGNLFISNQKRPNTPITKKESSFNAFYNTVVDDNSINTYYINRASDGKNRMITEGNVFYQSENSGRINVNQTTSMFNTPYFLNALMNTGETRNRQLGYLLLNSLPLSTFYERYLDNSNGSLTDYIFPSFNKFSAIHKLPYAWILKTGSLWNRYKEYVQSSGKTDMLSTIWKDFDYKKAYDPQTNNINRNYRIIRDNQSSKSDYQLNTSTSINTGFYPGLYNSFFEFLTGTNLFNNDVDTKPNTFWDKNLKLKTNIMNQTLRGPIMSHSGFFIITSDYSDFFEPEDVGKRLILPSAGYLPFQQAYYEVTRPNDQTLEISKEKVNIPQMFNGSAKLFWECSNYGWFNNNDIDYPQHDEYIKIIQNTNIDDKQYEFFLSKENYAKIEDLFGVFSFDELNLFENEFIKFCNDGDISEMFLDDKKNVDDSLLNLKTLFKRIFLVETTDESILEISKKQTDNLSNVLNEFLSVSVYLKLGNSKKFDRVSFGNFISASTSDEVSKMNPNTLQVYGTYTKGDLPGENQNVTLLESQNKNPKAWEALKLHLGFSTIPDLSYGERSYIYDFFIDNNIAFTEQNVKRLSKLIKIYATQKRLNDGNYNSNIFKQDITNLMSTAYTNRGVIEQQLRQKLPNELNAGPQPIAVVTPKFYGDSTKLEMWELFKSINDKWVAGVDFNNYSLFDEFLFFDRGNRDIGDDFIIKVDSIRKYCDWKNSNTSVMTLIRQILVENRMNFFVMPAYINFYGKPSRRFTDRNATILNNANDVFSTFGYVDYIDSAPKFLCQYIGRPSQTLSMDNDPNYPFKSDSFDLGVSGNNPIRNTRTSVDQYTNNKAVGFVVDFGTINQSVFKSIDISQNQNITSSEQIQTVVDMGKLGGNKKTSQQSTSLFELYKNRTYDCTVKTIGNVMLQPTMYFVLRHTPMFNGTYVIRKVVHTIGPGRFDTEVTGQRLSTLSNEKINNELADLNESFDKKLESQVRTLSSNNQIVALNSRENKYLTGQEAKNFVIAGRIPYQGGIVSANDLPEQTCNVNLYGYPNSLQSKLINEPYTTNVISYTDLIKEFKKIPDINIRLFLFSLLFIDGNSNGYKTSDKSFIFKMNNMYGASGDIEWISVDKVKGYRCLNYTDVEPRPYFSYNSLSDCLSFMENYFGSKLQAYLNDKVSFTCLNKGTFTTSNLNEQNRACLGQVFVKLFYNYWYTSLKDNVSNTNTLKYDEVNQYPTWLQNTTKALQLAVNAGLNK